MLDTILKTCSLCGSRFSARDLIYDPDLDAIGMTYTYTVQKSYYMFQHNTETCGTSFLIDTELFIPFIEEMIPESLVYCSEICEGHCVDIEDLSTCHQDCRNAPFRQFLLFMREQKAKKKVQISPQA
jgi:hypothetical protein